MRLSSPCRSQNSGDVLFLPALGYTNQEIALISSSLSQSRRTAPIMQKLKLKTRAELVLYALANGLIGPN